jgi:uncharacterized protein YbjT (DUF2867 family)
MRILLTGANGYIGARLLPNLLEEGHEVIALVRSSFRLKLPKHHKEKVQIVTADLLDQDSLTKIPENIDAAFYLVHSMTQSGESFAELEKKSAENFTEALKKTNVRQIVFLGGIANAEKLSTHLESRKQVENIIKESGIPYTIFRAGIIIGSGSASFEIIRDLVEKLPVMIAPRWVSSLSQPIAIRDVLFYLTKCLDKDECMSQTFDIGGPDKFTYKEMLEIFAEIRGLKRKIFKVPVLTPRLSSYWLYFVTSTNFQLAQSLVDSLKCEAVCKDNRIRDILPQELLSYREAIQKAFDTTEQHAVVSSWKDAMISSRLNPDLSEYVKVPKHGCLTDVQEIRFEGHAEEVIGRIWRIGGHTGWYYMDWAWEIRGFIDKVFGGVGLRRGRTHPENLHRGDSLDFWRVLLADKENGRLLLYAEMKVPGEAWLEFEVTGSDKGGTLKQTASFRPRGVLGRLYWYVLLPFHKLIFSGMAKAIAKG